MTRYDEHVKLAVDQAEEGDDSGKPTGYQASAQIHATLALAEQQRIANLIAIWGTTDVDGEVAGKAWDQITAALDV